MRDFGTADAVPLHSVRLSDVAGLHLPAGSMGPKVGACAQFTALTGHPSSIGALTDAAAVLDGTAGTRITSGSSPDRGFSARTTVRAGH
jgi:carbamate kinase